MRSLEGQLREIKAQPGLFGVNSGYVDPTSLDYNQYFDHLRAFNASVHRWLVSTTSKNLTLENGQALSTVGSDSRLEKGPVSPVEFLVYVRDKKSYHEGLETDLKKFLEQQRTSLHFDGLEVKFLEIDTPSESVINRGRSDQIVLQSPNRGLDSSFIAGDISVFNDSKCALFDEVTSPAGTNILQNIGDRIRQHKKVTTTGVQRYKGQDLVHVDMLSGIAYYDPSRNLQSFKQGPLRTVQYALVSSLIKLLRNKLSYDLVASIPSNTVDKIHALGVLGLLSLRQEQLRDLTDSYKYFLRAYNISQFLHGTSGRVELGVDISEVTDRARSIADICSSSLCKIQ